MASTLEHSGMQAQHSLETRSTHAGAALLSQLGWLRRVTLPAHDTHPARWNARAEDMDGCFTWLDFHRWVERRTATGVLVGRHTQSQRTPAARGACAQAALAGSNWMTRRAASCSMKRNRPLPRWRGLLLELGTGPHLCWLVTAPDVVVRRGGRIAKATRQARRPSREDSMESMLCAAGLKLFG